MFLSNKIDRFLDLNTASLPAKGKSAGSDTVRVVAGTSYEKSLTYMFRPTLFVLLQNWND